jgi:protein phosphatase
LGVLEPWHCRQSLLELSNLLVDEDGMLGLQRLYAEIEADSPLTIQDLGLVWQRFFQESQRTQFGSLFELMRRAKGW